MADTIWTTNELTYQDFKDEAFTGFDLEVWIRDDSSNAYELTDFITELGISGGERDIEQIVTFGDNKYGRQKIMEPIVVDMTTIMANHLPWSFLAGTDDGTTAQPDATPPYKVSFGNDTLKLVYDVQLVYSFHPTRGSVAGRVDIGPKKCIYLTDCWTTASPLTQTLEEPGEMKVTFKCIPTGTNATVEYTPDAGVNALTTDILPVA